MNFFIRKTLLNFHARKSNLPISIGFYCNTYRYWYIVYIQLQCYSLIEIINPTLSLNSQLWVSHNLIKSAYSKGQFYFPYHLLAHLFAGIVYKVWRVIENGR